MGSFLFDAVGDAEPVGERGEDDLVDTYPTTTGFDFDLTFELLRDAEQDDGTSTC